MTAPRFFRPIVIALFTLVLAVFGRAQQPATHTTWLLLNVDTAEALMVTDPNELLRLNKAGWKTNGTGLLADAADSTTAAVHRLFHPAEGGNDHLVTTNADELATALSGGYIDEGVIGFASRTRLPEMIPVYRFVKGSRHLCLISKDDLPWVTKNGWKSQGVDFWIWPAKSS